MVYLIKVIISWLIDMLQLITTFYKSVAIKPCQLGTKWSTSFPMSKMYRSKEHCSISNYIKMKPKSLEANYDNVVINNNKMVYELWINCSSYEHNIEQKGLVFEHCSKAWQAKIEHNRPGFICNTVRNNHVYSYSIKLRVHNLNITS